MQEKKMCRIHIIYFQLTWFRIHSLTLYIHYVHVSSVLLYYIALYVCIVKMRQTQKLFNFGPFRFLNNLNDLKALSCVLVHVRTWLKWLWSHFLHKNLNWIFLRRYGVLWWNGKMWPVLHLMRQWRFEWRARKPRFFFFFRWLRSWRRFLANNIHQPPIRIIIK